MIIIQNGQVIDPKSQIDEIMDIVIEDGKITDMGFDIGKKYAEKAASKEKTDTMILNADNLVVAPGLIDVHVHFRDPGLTYKEDLHTGAKAAAKGGFTTVVCMANTKPPADNVETVEYILEEGKKTGIHILPRNNNH